jgi:hypothetical protein
MDVVGRFIRYQRADPERKTESAAEHVGQTSVAPRQVGPATVIHRSRYDQMP